MTILPISFSLPFCLPIFNLVLFRTLYNTIPQKKKVKVMSANIRTALSGTNVPMLLAGLSGGLSVVLGALGSHAFLEMMDTNQFKAYSIANQYHIVHSVAMLVVAAVAPRVTEPAATHFRRAYALFAGGTFILAGSRYVYSTLHKPAFLGQTPILGGALLAAGWVCVALGGSTMSDGGVRRSLSVCLVRS